MADEEISVYFNTVDHPDFRNCGTGEYHKMLEDKAKPVILNNWSYTLYHKETWLKVGDNREKIKLQMKRGAEDTDGKCILERV